MTLSISRPAAGATVGPGYKITVHNTVGPVPVDDYFAVGVRNPDINQNVVIWGVHRSDGFLDVDVVLGAGLGRDFAMSFDNPMAQGVTCKIVVSQFHANGAFVDTVDVPGFHWDAIGGAYLMPWLVSNSSASNSTLAQILAAVSKTLPRTN